MNGDNLAYPYSLQSPGVESEGVNFGAKEKGGTTYRMEAKLPGTIVGIDNAELSELRRTVDFLQDENKRLKEENAELREKCMTRYEKIKGLDVEDLARVLCEIYDSGNCDGVCNPGEAIPEPSGPDYWLDWLQGTGWIYI